MSKRKISFLASVSLLGIAISPLTMADSVSAPTARDIAPVEHIVSQQGENHQLELGNLEENALAENTDSDETSGWSEIWE